LPWPGGDAMRVLGVGWAAGGGRVATGVELAIALQ